MPFEYQAPDDEQQAQRAAHAYLAEQKASIRRKSWWAVGIGGFVVVVHIVWLVAFGMAGISPDYTVLFRSIFFVLGLFAFCAGLYGLYHARNLTLSDVMPSAEAIEFAQRSELKPPYYTFILLGSLVAVFIAQTFVGFEPSIRAAGFVRSEIVEGGQYWRLITVGAVHGGLLHVFLNANVLYNLGGLVEYLSNRAHLPIVFVLSIVGGSLTGLLVGPIQVSSGASGGIMGLLGYLLIYAYRRKSQLPPDFLRSMLINVAFIAGFGIIGYQLIDNFANIGGFLVGAVYAFIQVPRDLAADPRKTNSIINTLGIVAIAIYIAEAAFAIFRITGRA